MSNLMHFMMKYSFRDCFEGRNHLLQQKMCRNGESECQLADILQRLLNWIDLIKLDSTRLRD